jgi:integrase
MSVYFDQKRKRWRFDFSRRIDGSRYRSTKLFPAGWSKNQAESYALAKSARYYAQATGIEKPRLSLAGAVKLYLDHRCPELRNGKKTAQDLAHLVDEIENEWLDGVAELATRYTIAQRGTLAPATIRNRLAYLKAAVRYAYRVHGYGDRNYAERMVLPQVNNERDRYETLPVLNKLWREMDAETRAVFKLEFYLGLRWRSELLTRKPEHVIRNRGETWLVIGTTKNGEPMMKPVHPAAIDCLKFIPFAHGDGYYYTRWHAALKKLGLVDFKPHDLRHSVASEILSRGGNLSDVQSALHQKSVQSAKRYAHRYPESLRRIMMGIGQKVTTQGGNGRAKKAARK